MGVGEAQIWLKTLAFLLEEILWDKGGADGMRIPCPCFAQSWGGVFCQVSLVDRGRYF